MSVKYHVARSEQTGLFHVAKEGMRQCCSQRNFLLKQCQHNKSFKRPFGGKEKGYIAFQKHGQNRFQKRIKFIKA